MQRPYALLRHKTCQSIFQDTVLHEEKDERYVLSVKGTMLAILSNNLNFQKSHLQQWKP